MPERIDLFDSTYGNFTARVLDDIRKDTYGVDIGQNSWTTADEYDRAHRAVRALSRSRARSASRDCSASLRPCTG